MADTKNLEKAKEYEDVLNRLEDSFGNWFSGKFESPKMTRELYPYSSMFSPINVNGI